MSDMSLVSGCVAYVGYVPCVRFVWLCPLCTGCLICGLCPICHCCTVPALWYRCVRICLDMGAVPGSVRVCTVVPGVGSCVRMCPVPGGATPACPVLTPMYRAGSGGHGEPGPGGPGALGYMGVEIVPGNGRYPPGPEVRRALGALCSGQTGPPSMLLHPPCSGGLWFVCGSGIYGEGLALVRAPTFLQLRGCVGGVAGRRAQVTER